MNVMTLQRGCCVLAGWLTLPVAVADQPWSVRATYWSEGELDAPAAAGDTAVMRRELFMGYDRKFDAISIAASYAHQPILIRAGEPANNGYFHLLDAAFGLARGPLSAVVKVGVHGSSNMFKYAEFSDDSLVASFSGSYQFAERFGVGLNGDHRFGHFSLYPMLSWSGAFGENRVDVELPVALRWRRHDFKLAMERYGEKWAALDAAESIHSAFYLQEWRIAASWQWPGVWGRVTPALGAGVSLNTQVEYYDLAVGWVEFGLDDSAFLFIDINF